MSISINDYVMITPNGYDTMVGRVDRIVKMHKPCEETTDESKWSVHVVVESKHPRNSGTFVVGYQGLQIAALKANKK